MNISRIREENMASNRLNGMNVEPDGKKIWYLNGVRHRENDLPAVECIGKN